MSQELIVFVVDDDRGIREVLSRILSSFDMHVVAFVSVAEFMLFPEPQVAACPLP